VYLEALAKVRTIVFDKTGTLTKGVFEVSGIHHSIMEEKALLELSALAESYSTHPISLSLRKAWGGELDQSRVSDVHELSGNGVTAKVDGQKVTVKGKLGELAYVMHDGITAKVEEGKIVVERKDDTIKNFHGLARALIHNNVVGVDKGYTKQLVIEGTGFKATLQGKQLALSLGFASPKIFDIPDGLKVTVENDGLQVTITGISKELVGESAARIRSFYPAEPYKGKGIKYLGEHIRRKQGKKVA
jgi:large subunit ribosomal protein L6